MLFITCVHVDDLLEKKTFKYLSIIVILLSNLVLLLTNNHSLKRGLRLRYITVEGS